MEVGVREIPVLRDETSFTRPLVVGAEDRGHLRALVKTVAYSRENAWRCDHICVDENDDFAGRFCGTAVTRGGRAARARDLNHSRAGIRRQFMTPFDRAIGDHDHFRPFRHWSEAAEALRAAARDSCGKVRRPIGADPRFPWSRSTATHRPPPGRHRPSPLLPKDWRLEAVPARRGQRQRQRQLKDEDQGA